MKDYTSEDRGEKFLYSKLETDNLMSATSLKHDLSLLVQWVGNGLSATLQIYLQMSK